METKRIIKLMVENYGCDEIVEMHNWVADRLGYSEDRIEKMEKLNELYHRKSAIEIMQEAFEGRDWDSWGETDFDVNCDYVAFDGFGRLVSIDRYSVHNFIIEAGTIETYIDDRMAEDEDITLEEVFEEMEEM